MRERIRAYLTFANVASAIALFVALGGGTAVALNGSNTVQSDDLGPGAQVKAADVADNAISSAKIANGQVRRGDLDPTAITAGITHIVGASPNNTDGEKEVPATCPSGKEVTGGGYVLNGGGNPIVYRSYAVDSNTWLVRAIDTSGGTFPWQLTVTAVCAG